MQLIDLFTTYKARVSIVYIEVPYQQLNSQNKNCDEVVPTTVLNKLTHILEIPGIWEAHEVTYQVSIK